MSDPTEAIRRQQLVEINAEPGSREYLEAKHGEVWDTSELQQCFMVLGFMAPYCVVQEKDGDRRKGSVMFQGSPRFYFSFQPE